MVSPFRVGMTVNPRRLSVNDSFHDVERNIRRAIARLNELWDEVHMSESARVVRVSTAFGHICVLLNDMVASEEEMVATVAREIENGMNNINSMRSQMGMEPWENRRAPPGSIELHTAIDNELRKLRPLYQTRKKEQTDLIERVDHLIYRLGIEDDNLCPRDNEELMPDHQLNALDARRLELEDMLQKRLKKVQKWQKEMVKFVRKLGQSAVPDDESIKAIMDIDFTGEEICISDTTVAKMEEYHGQLREMYTEYVQDREFRWLELYTRLAELWDLCHVADIERLIPPSYNPDKHSDEDIDKISTEISRLESLYGARKEVFDILTTWKEKWAEKLALEEKKKDPEYFQNRGRENNVYMDAKIERTLNDYTLPKLLKTLITAYEKYCQTHPNDEIRVDGFTPPDYVKYVLDEYNASKDVERKNRQMQRMVSTSALRTPQSGRVKLLQQRPVSSSKIEPLRKRLRYDSTLSHSCMNTTSASIASVITPTKQPMCGPKHSSPKTSTPRGGLDTSKKTTPLKTVKRTPISGTRLSIKKRTPLSSIKTPGNTRTPLRRSRRFFKV